MQFDRGAATAIAVAVGAAVILAALPGESAWKQLSHYARGADPHAVAQDSAPVAPTEAGQAVAARSRGLEAPALAPDPLDAASPEARGVAAFGTFLDRVEGYGAAADAMPGGERVARGEALMREVDLHERAERLLPSEALRFRIALLAKTVASASEYEARAAQLVQSYETRMQTLRESVATEQAALIAEYRARVGSIDREAAALQLRAGSPEHAAFVERRRIEASREVFHPARTRNVDAGR